MRSGSVQGLLIAAAGLEAVQGRRRGEEQDGSLAGRRDEMS